MLVAIAAAACKPDFGTPLSLVSAPRILALRADPAEAAPGDAVAWRALVAAPDGTIAAPALDWSWCAAQTPASSDNVVADACLDRGGAYLAQAAAMVSAAIPDDACRLFGSDLPPQTAGQPPERPRDPDATGGYYQPLRADLAGASAVALERIRCNLAGASAELAADFRARYTPNRNPTLLPLAAAVAGQPAALDQIPAGSTVTLTAAWTPDSPESYPVFDVLAQALVDHREAMRVSWFAASGALADERTGRDETDLALSTSTTWIAPPAPGVAHLWIVLRDSRGGLDFAAWDVVLR
ncbi:MAG TPA: hypothetical protein VFF06_00670 [Polyangia bacterium]|nr:hypothetical protein [Polyangia bacterium]